MNYCKNLSVCMIAAACILSMAAAALAANIVVNGDFEDTTDWGDPGTTENPFAWPSTATNRFNPAAQQSGVNAIGGSGTSAYMPAFYTSTNRRDFGQAFDNISSFVIELDVAMEDPGADEHRSYNSSFVVADSVGSTGINIRIVDYGNDGAGDLQVYNSGTWVTLPGLQGSITFDGDVTATPVVNHLKCIGWYADDDAYYDLVVTNASSQTFTESGLQYYAGGRVLNPDTVLTAISFSTFVSYGDYLLDNIVVEELVTENIPGDATRNGVVNAEDAAVLAANWLRSDDVTWADGDFNEDGIVDDIDATIMAANWTGTEVAVPEPGVLLLLAGMTPLLLLMAHKRARQ